jgi:hypothetical protein
MASGEYSEQGEGRVKKHINNMEDNKWGSFLLVNNP